MCTMNEEQCPLGARYVRIEVLTSVGKYLNDGSVSAVPQSLVASSYKYAISILLSSKSSSLHHNTVLVWAEFYLMLSVLLV